MLYYSIIGDGVAVEVTVKKWGNSKGVVFPKEFLDKKGIKEDDKILVEVVKKADLSEMFGLLKGVKMSGQEFKNMVRKAGE